MKRMLLYAVAAGLLASAAEAQQGVRTLNFQDRPVVSRVTGLDTHGRLVTLRGTVTYVDLPGGYFTLRDARGTEYGVYAEPAETRRNNAAALFSTLRRGETVTVNVRHIQR